ncbi:GcrA family cell cycle regulator [Methylobacterium frigidaeris]|uniref:GcrA family cell cycle regulator n=1 Tax=Methylobacterium frigidaeris TaxID=2038277 RepID=UPI003144D6B4
MLRGLAFCETQPQIQVITAAPATRVRTGLRARISWVENPVTDLPATNRPGALLVEGDARPASQYPMNQLVRMSHIVTADAVEEPSPSLRVPFAQSGAFVCKFIIGEPNDRAVCCGAPVQDGKSWCAFHRRIVFEPTRPGRLR